MKRVYVASSIDGPVKIGISADPYSRVREFVGPNVLKVDFASKFYNEASAVERAVHAIFTKKRLKGEWFDVTVEQAVEVIQQIIYEFEIIPEDKPVTGYKSARLSFRVPTYIMKELNKRSKEDGRSRSWIIAQALRCYLELKPKEGKP